MLKILKKELGDTHLDLWLAALTSKQIKHFLLMVQIRKPHFNINHRFENG